MSAATRNIISAAMFAVLLIPSVHLGWIGRDMPHLGYFQDDGLYLVSAKSLAQGTGYRILSLPQQPFQTKYPPLYSILLSAIWRADPVFPHNLRWALLFNLLMVPAYLLLARPLLTSLKFGRTTVWLSSVVMAFSPAFVFLGINLMPELMFASLVFACLIAAERASGGSHESAWALGAGLLGGAAYLTKSAGIVLMLSVVAGLLIRRRVRQTVLFLSAMLPAVIGWSLWVRAHTLQRGDIVSLYYTDYLGYFFKTVTFRDLPQLVSTNLHYLVKGIGGIIVFSPDDTPPALLLSLVVAAIALTGIVRNLERSGAMQYHLFAFLYILELVCWNFEPNERFLMPCFPLLAAGFCEGLGQLFHSQWSLSTSRTLARMGRGLAYSGVVVVVVLWIASVGRGMFETLPGIVAVHRARLSDYRTAFSVISNRCSPESVFVAYQDTLVYLYTGHRGFRPILSSTSFYNNDTDRLWEPFQHVTDYASMFGASHLFSTSGDYQTDSVISDHAAMQRLFSQNERLRLMLKSPNVQLYEIAPSPRVLQ